MKTKKANHDPLGIRLSIIIDRLYSGEGLSLPGLATEFGVHERTIYRDLHERLGCIDIIRENGHYRLSKNQLGSRKTVADILKLAKITYIDRLFPSFDKELISVLSGNVTSPFIVYTPPPEELVTPFGSFTTLTKAVIQRKCLHFVDKHHQRYKKYHLYRLIYVKQQWYLTGVIDKKLKVFSYQDVMNVEISDDESFDINEKILDIIISEAFIQNLPHFQVSVDIYLKASDGSSN